MAAFKVLEQFYLGRAILGVMKPSLALDAYREKIRRIVAANRGLNPRVFGSALRNEDTDDSDLDLLIDPAEGMTLFDMAAMAVAIESLTHAKVDVKTPEDLSINFRSKVVAEARAV
jgi:predicted nucleotidyltransferase